MMAAAERSAADGQVRLVVPASVRGIAETLERAGHETWCVGGAIRDALLKLPRDKLDLQNRGTAVSAERG